MEPAILMAFAIGVVTGVVIGIGMIISAVNE